MKVPEEQLHIGDENVAVYSAFLHFVSFLFVSKQAHPILVNVANSIIHLSRV